MLNHFPHRRSITRHNRTTCTHRFQQTPTRYDELTGDFYLSGEIKEKERVNTDIIIDNISNQSSKVILQNPCNVEYNKSCESTKEYLMASQIGYGETPSAAILNAEIKVKSYLASNFGVEGRRTDEI